MPRLVEDFNEFSTRHGDNQFVINGRIVFPDGASADQSGTWLVEPPTDRYQLLQLQRAYLLARAKLEVAARDKFKRDCEWAATYFGSAPGPPKNWKEQVAAGKARIDELTRQIVALDVEINKFPQHVNAGAYHAQQQYDKARAARELVAEIRSA